MKAAKAWFSPFIAICLAATTRPVLAQDFSHFLAPGSRGGETSGIALGDVNGDGDWPLQRDLVNDGRGNFQPDPAVGIPRPTCALALGDVDGDGRLDVVVGTNCGESAIHFNRASPVRPPE